MVGTRGSVGLGSTLIVVAAVSFAPPVRASDEALVVIVHADNPLSDIDVDTLRAIFLCQRATWDDGVRIVPINHERGTAERLAYDRLVLAMEPDAVERHWVDERIRGRARAPKQVPAALVARILPKLRGAIAYVRPSAVTKYVKVLSVGGKEPGESGYPLRVGPKK